MLWDCENKNEKEKHTPYFTAHCLQIRTEIEEIKLKQEKIDEHKMQNVGRIWGARLSVWRITKKKTITIRHWHAR
jgi:hypothetical protein